LVVACNNEDSHEVHLGKVSNEQVTPWGTELVGYETTVSDTPVKVAVLDSGIYKEHEDLKGKVVKEYNAIDPTQQIKDDLGHGTAVAGIITANDNNIGIVGVTQNVELYDVKVLDAEGNGSVENLILAIEWCIKEQVDLINISFGFQTANRELERVIEDAVSQDIIIVAAAGNTYGFGVDYPAKYEQVISVNAIKKDWRRPSSAARGKIDYVAPGDQILSTSNNNMYNYYSGTSFAAPFVTGYIAANLMNLREEANNSGKTLLQVLRDRATVLEEDLASEYGQGYLKNKD
jgi:subtilisin family serine protease